MRHHPPNSMSDFSFSPTLFDNPPTASTLSIVSAIPRAAILAGRRQAVRPWRLHTQDIATRSKGKFPWRRKSNRNSRRTAPIP
jgi:hypothetical protein